MLGFGGIMDKVIIDGVDVSECSYFNKETGFCKLGFKPETPPYCEQFTCYYKNFKRLQAENERLKNFLNHSFCDCELNEKYRQALQEIREYCEEQNLKADYTACEILDLITKAEKENE